MTNPEHARVDQKRMERRLPPRDDHVQHVRVVHIKLRLWFVLGGLFFFSRRRARAGAAAAAKRRAAADVALRAAAQRAAAASVAGPAPAKHLGRGN